MNILITGANGFVGKNLCLRLQELGKYKVTKFSKENNVDELKSFLKESDFVVHLAGINRPTDPKEFQTGNFELTKILTEHIIATGKSIPVIFSSSIQSDLENPYGQSKKNAENILLTHQDKFPIYIYKLPNVFGKWCKPNYNSAVATFAYNIINDLPVTIHDPKASLKLVYIDDVVNEFIKVIEQHELNKTDIRSGYCQVEPVYQTTVGAVYDKLKQFKDSRSNLMTETVGAGFDRALYATYISYFKPDQFSYTLKRYSDPRGVFVEFLKTKDSGQFSFFTAGVGVTRGGHYHHTKSEKFLVLQGKAKYKFRNLVTNEFYEVDVSAEESRVVETIPGWTHDITNIGNNELIVMLWACEIFDRTKPDTVACEV